MRVLLTSLFLAFLLFPSGSFACSLVWRAAGGEKQALPLEEGAQEIHSQIGIWAAQADPKEMSYLYVVVYGYSGAGKSTLNKKLGGHDEVQVREYLSEGDGSVAAEGAFELAGELNELDRPGKYVYIVHTPAPREWFLQNPKREALGPEGMIRKHLSPTPSLLRVGIFNSNHHPKPDSTLVDVVINNSGSSTSAASLVTRVNGIE